MAAIIIDIPYQSVQCYKMGKYIGKLFLIDFIMNQKLPPPKILFLKSHQLAHHLGKFYCVKFVSEIVFLKNKHCY